MTSLDPDDLSIRDENPRLSTDACREDDTLSVSRQSTETTTGKFWCSDALSLLKRLPDDIADLVFTSPYYEDARKVDFPTLTGEAYVDWICTLITESVRVCTGLVAFVINGRTRNFRYSCTPHLIIANLHREGIHLRRAPVFHRSGIPGSGGPDWLRNDTETIICATSGGRLPWSDNTAMGHPTVYDEGGSCTNRKSDGTRVGYTPRSKRARIGTHRAERQAGRKYAKPKSGIANPGDIIHCKVGGGHMGSPLAHENEAPFPESLAEFFIRSFCKPDGTVLDMFGGSGTTAAVAKRLGRRWIYNDIRESQCKLATQRLKPTVASLLQQRKDTPNES